MRKTISRALREKLAEQYPGLNKRIAYWRLLRYLFFGYKDMITGHPRVDLYHLAKAEELLHQLKSKHYVGKDLLEDFQKDVMDPETFRWSGWSHEEGRARIVIVTFTEEIEALITKELINPDKDRVYFDTGKKVTQALMRTQREMIRKEAETYFEFAIPEARPLLHYMNTLPTHNFSKIIDKNWDAALLKACQIQDPLKMRVQTEVLFTLKEDLQPFYKPSHRGCTPRIFPCNYSIPMLRKDIRKVLTQGWYEFDLANSQLAIVAKEWNINQVQDFLQTKQSIWVELFNHYNFNANSLKQSDELKYQGIKDVFKTALYSLIYGMPKGYLIKEVNEGLSIFNIKQGGKHYFNHPLIQGLYQAREHKFQEMNELTQVITIFNRTLPITGSKTTKGKPTQQRKDSIASLLAHQAQSVELYVLLPVVELASTTKDFYITLWQHDGFSIHFTDKSKVNKWIPRIVQVVQEKIDEQGILTHLDWELL